MYVPAEGHILIQQPHQGIIQHVFFCIANVQTTVINRKKENDKGH